MKIASKAIADRFGSMGRSHHRSPEYGRRRQPAGSQSSLQRGTEGWNDDRHVRERARDAAIAGRQRYPVRRAKVQLDWEPQLGSQYCAILAFETLQEDRWRETARYDR